MQWYTIDPCAANHDGFGKSFVFEDNLEADINLFDSRALVDCKERVAYSNPVGARGLRGWKFPYRSHPSQVWGNVVFWGGIHTSHNCAEIS
jgi:hypothetical protein